MQRSAGMPNCEEAFQILGIIMLEGQDRGTAQLSGGEDRGMAMRIKERAQPSLARAEITARLAMKPVVKTMASRPSNMSERSCSSFRWSFWLPPATREAVEPVPYLRTVVTAVSIQSGWKFRPR